ncbi:hypothetical protein [Thiogranum longum]|uniref:hypothetical protein n=1 Tax=Thiogranum longum TaxID=1537524 RepID=UPI0010457994|nr:hypothetical protein [Thiogranum longum]
MSLIISLLLTLSPMAALDAAAAIAGKGDCMMMDMNHNTPAGSDLSAQSADGQMTPDCLHCKDDSCDDHNCASHGCSAGHNLSLIQSPGLAALDHNTVSYSACLINGLLSHSAPPLLRPPV